MGRRERYSQEFKEAVVKKLLTRGNQTKAEFCDANNLALGSVSLWQSECGNISGMNNKKNKSKLSTREILKIISEAYTLNEEELGIYLRKNGLHASQLVEWRDGVNALFSKPKAKPNKKDARDLKIKDLEKNLRKKDAALAEVSALLILQKKANLLWPSPSEDEE